MNSTSDRMRDDGWEFNVTSWPAIPHNSRVALKVLHPWFPTGGNEASSGGHGMTAALENL